MARIRTIKQKVSGQVRRDLASKYGCTKGETLAVACAQCDGPGYIEWRVGNSGRGAGQVIFSLEMDHIIPESTDGATSAENLQLLCRPCNRRKGARVQQVS